MSADIDDSSLAQIRKLGWPIEHKYWNALSDSDREQAVGKLAANPPGRYKRELSRVGFEGLGTVLDAGCGFGHFAKALATLNKTAIGVDTSPQRLAIADSLARETGAMSLCRAELESLPFRDACFDGIFCLGVVSFLDARLVLREFGRVICPDGRLYMDINGVGSLPHIFVDRIVRGYGGRRWYWFQVLVKYFWHGLRGRSGNYAVPERRFREILAEAGFEILALGMRSDRQVENAPQMAPGENNDRVLYWGLPLVIEVIARKRP